MSQGTPDMVRIYVVERLPKQSAEAKAAGAPAPDWVSVGTYDSPTEAGSHASSLKPTVGAINAGIRVRQFWVQSTWPEGTGPSQTLPTEAPSADQVELLAMACLDHPTRTAKMYTGGQPPRCPDCHKNMVTQTFIDALTDADTITLK